VTLSRSGLCISLSWGCASQFCVIMVKLVKISPVSGFCHSFQRPAISSTSTRARRNPWRARCTAATLELLPVLHQHPIRPCAGTESGLLREHADGRGAVAPDHRHEPTADGGGLLVLARAAQLGYGPRRARVEGLQLPRQGRGHLVPTVLGARTISVRRIRSAGLDTQPSAPADLHLPRRPTRSPAPAFGPLAGRRFNLGRKECTRCTTPETRL
jgi:hypothetical protein